MGLSRDDFGVAFLALAGQHKSPKELRNLLKEHYTVVASGNRIPLAEKLGVVPGTAIDLRSSSTALDALGEMLLEFEICTEAELEKLVASFLSRTYRKTLPGASIPPSLSGFDIQWELGRGRTGVVYRGRRRGDSQELAIKVFRPESRPDPARLRNLPKISEPGLVRTVEAGEDYLAMEFIAGMSVEAMLADRKLSLRHGFELIEKTARILAPPHTRGLAHGSLAPGTLLVDQKENVHLTEFGLAAGNASDDVFALGAVLYEIATGVSPYDGFHASELKLPSRLNSSVGDSAERIIAKALSRSPDRRYRDAAALADDIARYLRHEEVLAEDPSVGTTPRRTSRAPIIATVVAIVIVAVALLLMWSDRKPAPSSPSREESRTEAPSTSRETVRKDEPSSRTTPPVKPQSEVPKESTKKGPLSGTEERELLAEGSKALARGDYDQLLALADEFLSRGADRHTAYYWLAVAYRAKKEPEKALAAIDQAIHRAEEKLDYVQFRFPLLVTLAEAQRALKDVEQIYGKDMTAVNGVIRTLGQQIRAGDDDPSLLLQRGVLLHYKRNYRQAASDFHAAVQAGDSKALYFLGLSLMADDRRTDAADALRQFLAAHSSLRAAEEARQTLAELESK